MFIRRKVDPASWGGQWVFRDPGSPLFEARDSGFESTFGIESMRGRWNTKNNPRDYGIVQNCVGIAELKPQSNLSKTGMDVVAGLQSSFISRHFLQFFHLTGLQNSRLFFCSKPVFNTRRAALRYSRAADLSFDRSHVLGLRENRRDV